MRIERKCLLALVGGLNPKLFVNLQVVTMSFGVFSKLRKKVFFVHFPCLGETIPVSGYERDFGIVVYQSRFPEVIPQIIGHTKKREFDLPLGCGCAYFEVKFAKEKSSKRLTMQEWKELDRAEQGVADRLAEIVYRSFPGWCNKKSPSLDVKRIVGGFERLSSQLFKEAKKSNGEYCAVLVLKGVNIYSAEYTPLQKLLWYCDFRGLDCSSASLVLVSHSLSSIENPVISYRHFPLK